MAVVRNRILAERSKPKRLTEAEIAGAVMDELIGQGWDCYPEVILPHSMRRADIVAVRPFPFLPHRKMVHIVECKSTWSLSLLEQGLDRTDCCNFVSLASQGKCSFLYEKICREKGIGRIVVSRSVSDHSATASEYFGSPANQIRSKSRFYAKWVQELIDSLHPDMKNYRPGTTSDQGYSTPWRRTMDRAARFVADNPGCTVKELVEGIDTHYSSITGAKTGVLTWLPQRPDIRVDTDKRPFRFYPVEAH